MEKDKVLEVIRLEVDRDVPALIGSGIGTLSLDWAAHRRQHFERVSRAILTALEREGWAVVPVVPTEAMIEAAIHADMPGGRWGEDTFRESQLGESDAPVVWTAMLKASPLGGGE